jgi:hypothetical protein
MVVTQHSARARNVRSCLRLLVVLTTASISCHDDPGTEAPRRIVFRVPQVEALWRRGESNP